MESNKVLGTVQYFRGQESCWYFVLGEMKEVKGLRQLV